MFCITYGYGGASIAASRTLFFSGPVQWIYCTNGAAGSLNSIDGFTLLRHQKTRFCWDHYELSVSPVSLQDKNVTNIATANLGIWVWFLKIYYIDTWNMQIVCNFPTT